MTSQQGVSAAMVSLLGDYLSAQGLDAEAVIGPALPKDAMVTPDQWQIMLRTAAEVSGDTAFGLSLARHVTPRQFGLVGYLASSCDTVMEALQRMQQYSVLIAQKNPTRLQIHGELLEISWPLLHGASGLLWDAFGMGALLTVLRQIAGDTIAARHVHFVDRAPDDAERYNEFFGCVVAFGRAAPMIALPLSLLQMPLSSADPELLALLDAQAAERLQSLLPISGELHRLRKQLPELIRTGRARLSDLAAMNRISARSLQRRLTQAGTSFQALLDDTRRQLAIDDLSDNSIDLREVAQRLGYTEQSSFTRAFQQWTGQTPGQWRRSRR